MFKSMWGGRVPWGLFKSGLLTESWLIETLSWMVKSCRTVKAWPRLVKSRRPIKTVLWLVKSMWGIEALLGLVKPWRTIKALLWQVKSWRTLKSLLRLVKSWVVSTTVRRTVKITYESLQRHGFSKTSGHKPTGIYFFYLPYSSNITEALWLKVWRTLGSGPTSSHRWSSRRF